jgi:hypothetical protein
MEFFVNIWQKLLGAFTQVGAWAGELLWTYGTDLLMILVILVSAFLIGMLKADK